MVSALVTDVLPEWEAFAHAVHGRRPDAGTWCEAWTVRDVVIHQTGNAEELVRVLGAHLAGQPVNTRGFDREDPYRAMADSELWSAFIARCEELSEVSEAAASELSPETEVAWTGRYMKVPWFAEHMREELVLHRWDVTGDDATARQALAEAWMTEHSVAAVGPPLLARGSTGLDLGTEGRVEGRLRVPDTDDVLVVATTEGNSIEFIAPAGDATVESDAAARVLFLWGRRTADPTRWHSQAGPEALGRVRTLLSGY